MLVMSPAALLVQLALINIFLSEYHYLVFWETTEPFESKVGLKVPWMVLYKMYVFLCVKIPRLNQKYKMTTTVHKTLCENI